MKYKRLNRLLLAAILLINAYIIVLPVVPAISYWWQSRSGQARTTLLSRIHAPASTTIQNDPIYKENRLVVPAMLLDEPVYDGKDARTLHNGLWRRPQTSTPSQGGNTVIAGHRFTYTTRHGTLYYLDKVRVGDELALFWNGKKYLYKVSETKVVPATATQIELPTSWTQLTLYTCTPLFNPKDRLVVIAKLEVP